MKRWFSVKRIVLLSVVLLVVWGIYSTVRASTAPKTVTTENPVITDLTVTTTASGKIKAKDTASLRFAATGRISSLTIKEGDHVKKGQVLGYINGSDIKAQEEKALADYRYQLEVIREFEKNNENKPRDDKYTMDKWQLEAQRDSVEATLRQVRTGYTNRSLIAPIDGQVTKIYKFPGDIAAGDVIVDIQNGSEIEFVAEVDEQDIGTVAIGQSVLINLDAYPQDELPATITEIENIAQVGTSGNTYFPVNIIVTPSGQDLRIGMNGDAIITTAQKTNVLTIPLELLNEDEEEKEFVYIVEGTSVKKQIIQTGLQNDTSVEVIAGLSPEDRVITSDPTNLKENDIVTVTTQ